ncbi:MAG: endonuclease III [Acidimicrobiales bacterium]
MESARKRQARALAVVAALADAYPGSTTDLCALQHVDPFQLIVATILSAQCTDERVNAVTPALFAAYPDPQTLSRADPEALEQIIRPTGFFRAKARNLVAMAGSLTQRFGGQVPRELDDLVTLPGVGRKTGNVVRSVAFGLPGLPVDTHVGRLSRRLGLTDRQDPEQVESELNALVPESTGGVLSLRLILHGRRVCTSRKPRCGACVLAELCPSAAR